MNFLNPWLLAGALLAALPVLIHIFDRRRLPEVVLPTLRFLRQVNEQTKRKLRLRDALLLAARVLAILLLAAIVAKPVWQEDAKAAAGQEGSGDVIFVLDASFGMRYQIDGSTLFSLAQKRVRDESAALLPGQEAAVITCDNKWQILSENFAAGDRLASAIDKGKPGDAITHWAECLRGALALAAKSRNSAVDIRVFTNLAAQGWEHDALPEAPAGKTLTINVVDVAGQDLPNRAIVNLDLARGYGNSGEAWSVTVQAANHGPAAQAVAVHIEADGGKTLAQGLFDWEGPGPRQKTLSLSPPGDEFVGGNAKLDADSLPEDDERPFQFYFGKPVGVLLVDGAPGAVAEEGESYFPMTALRPGRVRNSVEPKVLTRTTLEPKDLAGIQAIMLLNVGELNDGTLTLLRKFVENGGGLFWSMGDRVKPAAYAAAGSLLPGRFRTLRDLRAAGNEGVRLASFPGKHPIFQDLDQANLATASFLAYQQLEGIQADAKILLEFADGSPAMVETTLGRGRIIWFASTVDDAWNNLPFRPFYLPLMQQTVRYLAGTLKPAMQRTYPLDTKVDLAEHLDGSRATVRTPDGRVFTIDPARGSSLAADTSVAGLYRVLRDDKPLPAANFIIARAPEASDLTRIAEDRLQEKIADAGYTGGVESSDDAAGRKIDPTLPLLALMTLTLWVEAGLAKRGAR